MINLNTEKAKSRYHREYILSTMQLEYYGIRLIAPILGRCFLDAARLLEFGITNFDSVILNNKDRLNKGLLNLYKRTGVIFGDEAFDAFEKEFGKTYAEVPLTRGMKEDYWGTYGVWAKKTAAKKIVDINDITRENIRLILEKGRADGKSYGMIAKDMRNISPLINKQRAYKIARTEIHTASVKSMDEAFDYTKVEFEREWRAIIDQRTRRTTTRRTRGLKIGDTFSHVLANGEITSQDGKFIRTGEALSYPGDPDGSPGNIIFCRCILLYHAAKKTVIPVTKPIVSAITRESFKEFKNADDIAEWEKVDSKRWVNKLTKDEIKSLKDYKRSRYEEINKYLRDSEHYKSEIGDLTVSEIQNAIKNINSASNKSGLIKENMIVYRAVKDFTHNWDKATGTVLQDKAFMSTTLLKKNADDFLKYSANRDVMTKADVVMRLKVPKKSKGFFLDGINPGKKHDENEFLLDAATKYKINKVRVVKASGELKGEYTLLDCEVIKSKPIIKVKPKIIKKIKKIKTRGHLILDDISDKKMLIKKDFDNVGIKKTEDEIKKMTQYLQAYSSDYYSGIRYVENHNAKEFIEHFVKQNYNESHYNKFKEMSGSIKEWLKVAPKFDGDILYRGLRSRGYDKFINTKIGDIIDFGGTSSTTSSEIIVKDFIGSEKGVKVIIKEGTKKGASIKFLSRHLSENEVLIPSDAQFKILSRELDNENKLLKLVVKEL